MEDDKDRDIPHAPLPPHERGWRHPAEIGEWSRTTNDLVTSAPPLSRRLTAVVAAVSVVLSVAVVAIAIPREGRSEMAVDPPVTIAGVRSQTIESVTTLVTSNVEFSDDTSGLVPGAVVYLHTPLSAVRVAAVIGLSTSRREGFHPLNVKEPIDDLVLVSNADEKIIGVARTIRHQTWLITSNFINSSVVDELGR